MYYENFLNSLTPLNVIPESASFNDMSIFTERAIQDAYNEAAISLACQEIAVFESVVLREEDTVGDAADSAVASATVKKSVLDYVKEFFAKIWKAIKEFFQKLIDKIKAFFDKKQLEAMNKLMKKFNAAVAVYKSASGDAKNDDFGYFADPGLAKLALDFMAETPGEAEAAAREALDGLIKLSKEKRDSTAGQEYIEKNFNVKDNIDKIRGDKTVKKFVKSYLEDVVNGGDENKDLIRIMGSNIGSKAGDLEFLVRNVRSWMDGVKKTYQKSKKAIDTMMKQARQLTNINHRSVRAYCSACRKLSGFLTKICSACNRFYNRMYRDGVKCVKKVIAGAKKWQSGAKNESVSYYNLDEGFDFYLEEDEGEEAEGDDVDFDMSDDEK
jgi:hypothetical protein